MSKIGPNYQIHHIPRTSGQSKGAEIAEIKMEIARVQNQAQAGLISKEEAQQKMAMLEAKLAQAEQTVSQINNQQPQSIDSINQNKDTKPLDNTQSSHNENENNNQDAQQRHSSQDVYFAQQALYNRAFHHI